jgi:hypothetical protein
MPRRKQPGAKKRAMHPNSLANLIKSKPGDPSRNPLGHNGRHRSEYVAAFLEEPDDTELGKKLVQDFGMPAGTPRIVALLQRDFLAGMGRAESARRLLIEQYAGKARIKMDITSDGEKLPGVMVVPIAKSQAEWEQGCMEDQRRLKANVKE